MRYLVAFFGLLGLPSLSMAQTTWTPLIAASDFTGVRTDLLTAVAGVISVILIILGVGLLLRLIGR